MDLNFGMKTEFNGDRRKKNQNSMKKQLGQYFTVSELLQKAVISFIADRNAPRRVLEPSFGEGHLLHAYLHSSKWNSEDRIDGYEIDDTLPPLLATTPSLHLKYQDFLTQVDEPYDTIIGNPPFVKQNGGKNLYLQFIQKCVKNLGDHGELIFIVPSEFFKLTSASKLITEMVSVGSFTDVFFPHDETLFEGASVDVVVFRFEKGAKTATCNVNGSMKHVCVNNGIVSFRDDDGNGLRLSDFFSVHVGPVSGCESVFRNETLGNVSVLCSKGQYRKCIFLESFPSGNGEIDEYLLGHKNKLMARRIRKMTEETWFQWGALRNMHLFEKFSGKRCIYLHTLTRRPLVAFDGTVEFFASDLLCIVPRERSGADDASGADETSGISDEKMVSAVVNYLNSDECKQNYVYSGRFKIGHRQVENILIPEAIYRDF